MARRCSAKSVPSPASARCSPIVLTSLYLVGMLERRDRTVARMGYDSLAVLGVYFAGIAVLWTLR
ncbi:MAG: hypothetical protein ACREUX_06740 [Burkholderiales bacterium]